MSQASMRSFLSLQAQQFAVNMAWSGTHKKFFTPCAWHHTPATLRVNGSLHSSPSMPDICNRKKM